MFSRKCFYLSLATRRALHRQKGIRIARQIRNRTTHRGTDVGIVQVVKTLENMQEYLYELSEISTIKGMH